MESIIFSHGKNEWSIARCFWKDFSPMTPLHLDWTIFFSLNYMFAQQVFRPRHLCSFAFVFFLKNRNSFLADWSVHVNGEVSSTFCRALSVQVLLGCGVLVFYQIVLHKFRTWALAFPQNTGPVSANYLLYAFIRLSFSKPTLSSTTGRDHCSCAVYYSGRYWTLSMEAGREPKAHGGCYCGRIWQIVNLTLSSWVCHMLLSRGKIKYPHRPWWFSETQIFVVFKQFFKDSFI